MKVKFLMSLLALAALSACGEKTPAEAPSAVQAAQAPAPVPATAPATVPAAAPAAPAASAADLAIGEKAYAATCAACHTSAVMGAPKLGDKAAWAARIAKGQAALYGSAIDGLKLMPPRGGNAALKDEELKAAVDYMLSKVQ